MIRNFLKWLRLPPSERWRTARLAGTLLWIKAFLKTSSIKTAPKANRQATPTREDLRIARDTTKALELAANGLPFSTTCLERSVALQRALRRRQIPVELRIGVRQGGEGLEAHAWVETSGVVLNDSEDVYDRYSAFEESVLPSHLQIR